MLLDFDHYSVVRGHALHVLRKLPDTCIDAFVTDPPYGIALRLGTRHRGAKSIAGDGRLEARMLWQAALPEMARVAKPDSLHLIFGIWRSPWILDELAAHFAVKGCIVWDKHQIGLGHFLRSRYELIYLVAKGRPRRHIEPAPADVWTFHRIGRTRHPCEKPVPLLQQCVRFVSAPGELVADPFCGIASTGVACLREGRRFWGVEIDRRFAAFGSDRLAVESRGNSL